MSVYLANTEIPGYFLWSKEAAVNNCNKNMYISITNTPAEKVVIASIHKICKVLSSEK